MTGPYLEINTICGFNMKSNLKICDEMELFLKQYNRKINVSRSDCYKISIFVITDSLIILIIVVSLTEIMY